MSRLGYLTEWLVFAILWFVDEWHDFVRKARETVPMRNMGFGPEVNVRVSPLHAVFRRAPDANGGIMAHLTANQMRRLLEIDAAGQGIYDEVRAFIAGLTPKSVRVGTERRQQAKMLWDKGFGKKLGLKSFSEYLATIPQIPEGLKLGNKRFPLLVLVDARVGFAQACALAGIYYSRERGRDEGPSKAYWLRCQDGQINRRRGVRACKHSFARDEREMNATQGVALYIQHPESIDDHIMVLSGSYNSYIQYACLGHWDGEIGLRWLGCSNAHPDFGTASRLKCSEIDS